MKHKYHALLSKYRDKLTEVAVIPNDFTEEKGKDFILVIGDERVEISDYKLQSSSTEDSELNVTIKGIPSLFEMLSISKEPKQSD